MASLKDLNRSKKAEGALGKWWDEPVPRYQATMTEAKETMANLKGLEQIEKEDAGETGQDDALYEDTRRAVKSVQKAADGISEITPVTVLSVVLGLVIP
jgi:hypothetical protein